jgi:hypothetical protein
LHGVAGVVRVEPYRGDNPLFRHGPIRVAADRRHFEHADGTPFFWLGDTWWMGLCRRLHWPEEFRRLTADRKVKGFNVVQIVAGLYPDMPPFDPRGAGEAGFPWEPNYARIRPAYFDAADARLRHLIDQGIIPCLVGAWGYYLPWMGEETMKAHWRYLIARYGAWPVVWCAAGEANLPWYLAEGFPYDDRAQVRGWTEILRFIRATDPWRRPLTIHPTAIHRYTSRHATEDPSLLDFDMLQTPHGRREAALVTIRAARESYGVTPVMPVVDGEASYERLMDSLPTEWTRAMFWLCLTNGAAGHTYGANGIWQVNRRGKPHGKSPHGGSYGVIAWDEAMDLPGSRQVALGKRFFESLPWTDLKPMPETAAWADPEEVTDLGDWIWYPEGDPRRDAPTMVCVFRRTFDIPDRAAVRRAMLRITADDQFTAWLNDQELGSGSRWNVPETFEVLPALRPGRNVLAVRAANTPVPVLANPAGLSAVLILERSDGSRTRLVTDASWRAAKAEAEGWRDAGLDDTNWPAARVTARFGEPPWGRVGRDDPPLTPQACGIGTRLRVVYGLGSRPVLITALEPGGRYRVTSFDPATGERRAAEPVTANEVSQARLTPATGGLDWVLLLERE